MNRNIRKLGAVIIGLYLILFVKLNWIQVVQKQSLDTNPLNTAQVRRDYNRPRGSISSADGALLAQSIANPDPNSEFDRIRVYPEGDLFGQITGYFSFTFGSSAHWRMSGLSLRRVAFISENNRIIAISCLRTVTCVICSPTLFILMLLRYE